MAEYIEREAAIDCLHLVCVPQCRKYAQEEIKKIHAADVAPVRHGWWREGAYAGYRCSECRTTWDAPTNYCPYCGADMREADNG